MFHKQCLAIFVFIFIAVPMHATNWYVGAQAGSNTYGDPVHTVTRICQTTGQGPAIALADGDVVNIDATVFTPATPLTDDFCILGTGMQLTLQGFNGLTGSGFAFQRAMVATSPGVNGLAGTSKGVYEVGPQGNVTFQYLEITSPNPGNGCDNCACTRYDNGASLTWRWVYCHDAGTGILGSIGDPAGDILVEHSEFARLGNCVLGTKDAPGQVHNIYIGNSRSFTMRYSYSHNCACGHLLKSRAFINAIYYNRLSGEYGAPSFAPNLLGAESIEINLPIGGVAYVVGNEIEQGAAAPILNGSTISSMIEVQFDNECTSTGAPHGLHWYQMAPFTANVGVSDTVLNVDSRFSYMFPPAPFTANVRSFGRLLTTAQPADTSISVDSAADFPSGTGYILTNDAGGVIEQLLVTKVVGLAPATLTVRRGYKGTVPAKMSRGEAMVLMTPEQITVNSTSGGGAQWNVTRAVNNVHTAHTAKDGAWAIGLNPQNELHIVNNTLASSPSGIWDANILTPADFSYVQYAISGPNTTGNPQCQYNVTQAPRLVNNVFGYGPPQIAVYGFPYSAIFSASLSDLVIDRSNNKKVSSVMHPFTTSDLNTQIYVPQGLTGFTAGNYTIQSLAGTAAILNAAIGNKGVGKGQVQLYGAVPAAVYLNNQMTFSGADMSAWFASPVFDDPTTTNYVSGLYDYRLLASAAPLIGQGLDMSTSTLSIPCGGFGLPDTCTELVAAEYQHPVDFAARGGSLDIGAHSYPGESTSPAITMLLPTLSLGQNGAAVVTLPAASANGAVMVFQTSDETAVPRPNSIWVPAGSTAVSVPLSKLSPNTATFTAFFGGTSATGTL